MVEVKKRELVPIAVWWSGREPTLNWIMRDFYEAMRKQQVCAQDIDIDVWDFRDGEEAFRFLRHYQFHNESPHRMKEMIMANAGRNVIVEVRAIATQQEVRYNYHSVEETHQTHYRG